MQRIQNNLKSTQDHQKSKENANADRKAFRHAVNTGNAGLPAPPDPDYGPVIGAVLGGKLTLIKAKTYLPPQCVIFHDPRESRIQGYRGTHGCAFS